jgi:cell division protein ZapD
VNDPIIYEFPLNERIRVFIRLEQLFIQMHHFLTGTTVLDKRAAIKTLLDILMIFSRNDLKSEIIKEIDRHVKVFSQMSDSQNVDKDKLKSILSNLNSMSKKLYANTGKIGGNVLASDLFQSISQRSAIPGGTCSFDLPAFHYWLEKESNNQRNDLEQWVKPFDEIRTALDTLLEFIRSSGHSSQETAEAGFFQLTLDSNQPYQLLRVKLAHTLPYFAETSGGKHRFTIRMMCPSHDNNRPVQTQNNVPFELTCCIL